MARRSRCRKYSSRPRQFQAYAAGAIQPFDRLEERSGLTKQRGSAEAAVAHDLGGDALRQAPAQQGVALVVGPGEDEVSVGVDVDESGSGDESSGVDSSYPSGDRGAFVASGEWSPSKRISTIRSPSTTIKPRRLGAPLPSTMVAFSMRSVIVSHRPGGSRRAQMRASARFPRFRAISRTIFSPWKRPFSMKILLVARPATTPPAR